MASGWKVLSPISKNLSFARVCWTWYFVDTCAELLYNKTQKGAHHGHYFLRFPYQDLLIPKGTPLHHNATFYVLIQDMGKSVR